MLKLFPPRHPGDLESEAHLEVNAALKSVPMPALKCAGFLPLPFQLLKSVSGCLEPRVHPVVHGALYSPRFLSYSTGPEPS